MCVSAIHVVQDFTSVVMWYTQERNEINYTTNTPQHFDDNNTDDNTDYRGIHS
eukprot:m.3206 g.3206  ORF g.3206 m.3206 type:complete len:53 (-) comp2090_c0_seq1:64-222(-)